MDVCLYANVKTYWCRLCLNGKKEIWKLLSVTFAFMLKSVQTCVLLLCLSFEGKKRRRGGEGVMGFIHVRLRFPPCALLIVSDKILVKKTKKKEGMQVHIMAQWCKTVFLRQADVVVLP